MIRRTPLQRKSRLKRGKQLVKSRIKRKRRKPSEFARIYGSKERVEYVKSLPCLVCKRFRIPQTSPTENVHTENGGLSRKAGADTIVPICADHHRGELHQKLGQKSFQEKYGIDLEQEAAKCEAAWQAHLTERNTE